MTLERPVRLSAGWLAVNVSAECGGPSRWALDLLYVAELPGGFCTPGMRVWRVCRDREDGAAPARCLSTTLRGDHIPVVRTRLTGQPGGTTPAAFRRALGSAPEG